MREGTMYRGIDWGEREAGAIAVGAVLFGLIDHLIARKLLTPAEVRDVLTNVDDILGDRAANSKIAEARMIVRDRIIPGFAKGINEKS
jgi:hypothetical protein